MSKRADWKWGVVAALAALVPVSSAWAQDLNSVKWAEAPSVLMMPGCDTRICHGMVVTQGARAHAYCYALSTGCPNAVQCYKEGMSRAEINPETGVKEVELANVGANWVPERNFPAAGGGAR
jgi:hypothetical protein